MNANFKNLCFNGLYALAILVSPVGQLLILPIQLVYATSISPYDSGYNHGCDDTQISEPPDRYINQPEKGPSFHTDEFMNGYNDGFTICLNEIGNNEITDEQSNESNSFVNNTGQSTLQCPVQTKALILAPMKMFGLQKITLSG